MEKEVRNLAITEEKAYHIRMHLKVTQREFANLLGVSASYVSNWENGYNEITIVMLNKICNLGNTTFDYMMGLSDVINPLVHSIENVDKMLLKGSNIYFANNGNIERID